MDTQGQGCTVAMLVGGSSSSQHSELLTNTREMYTPDQQIFSDL